MTATTTVQVYLNTNTRNSFMHGFSHGDQMVTSDDLLTFEFDKCADTVAADKAFKIGNLRLADRNGKQYLPQIRSISVGDVIAVDGIFYAVADFGFRTVVPSLVKRTTTEGVQALADLEVAAPWIADADRIERENADYLVMSGQYSVERVA